MPDTPADAPDDLSSAQLRLHGRSTRAAVLSSFAAAAVLALLLAGSVPSAVPIGFLAALSLALGVRLAVRHAHLRAAPVPSPARWLRRYRAGFALHGLVWMGLGLAVVGLGEQGGPQPTELVLLALVAISSGALVTAAFDPWASGLFSAIALPPMVIHFAVNGGREERSMLLAMLMFLAVAALVARRQQRTVMDALAARGAERRRAVEAERARRELADQTELQRQLLRTTQQGYWFIDPRGRTTDLNAAMSEMLGRPRDEVLGQHVTEFFDEAGRAVLRRELARRRAGITGAYEIDIGRPDGTRLHCLNNATPLFDADGRPVGSVGLWTDLSEIKRTEQRLRTHQWLVNAITHPVTLIGADRRFMMVNDAWCAFTGIPRAEAEGRPVDEVLGPARFTPAHAQALQACLEGDQAQRIRVEIDLGGERGRRLLETAYYPYLDAASGVRCAGALSQDVTESARAQEAIVEARDEAERANRAKSQFLAQMSHELRTPMNAIVGFGQLLESDPRQPLAPRQQRHVQEILRAGEHLLGLMNELLDLGRIEAGKLELTRVPVPLAALAGECLELLRAQAAGRSVALLAPRIADEAVLADPLRLRQVLLNLLGNAVKYNRSGGQVRLSIQREGDEVLLSVEDTGPGLDPSQIQRLFQPFERLGAERRGIEGAGIGLALSRRLVEAMGGRIGVASEPGRGSRFWVALPVAQSPAAPQPAPAEAVASSLAAPARVLYIEDNLVNIALMEAMLERLQGVQLHCAALPEDGLRMAAQSTPALILLDIQLPGMDGFEVLARLRASPATARTPVVAVSANALPADKEAARQAGFDAYLTKPLHLPELLATVRRLLDAEPATA